ncbi:ABC-2 type transport system permease protein [Haloactinopolyspora alba]|uniref:ABC-2 type transport system permease protein n=1 Tax=Haloactinopolyspora alba TaxID=648780 RepID=A0A2P8EBV1_9ACTN|nr:ABC transporter permease subunit [Haloactinopolyspora alba]PSL06958.1 ABC-2 type transport system permease protein [Haloactinopolyspora alba]
MTTTATTTARRAPAAPGGVLRQMLRERVRSLLWWSIAVGALAAITGGSYPTVKEFGSGFDEMMEQMPEGVSEMLGASSGLVTPDGYLNSQFYSNIFPILLLVFGIMVAAWTVAGAEREGTLEPLLANPVSRTRVALERFAGVAVLLAVLTLVGTGVLAALRGPFELDPLGLNVFAAVGVATFLLALLFASLTFAVGAATGSKGAAIAVGAGLAAATYVVFALSAFVDFFDDLRWTSPWHWFLEPSPLTDGWTPASTLLPLAVIVPAVVIGTAVFARRDLR